MPSKLDHLVVAASNLEQGVNYIRDVLGVEIPKGGEHPLMGTHNHVMRIGDEIFLEVIAINPEAPPPSRPRWFGLDDPAMQHSLQQRPRLVTWAANTNDLEQLQADTPMGLGEITPLSRGNLSWLFAVPEDGRLLASGFIPNVMQWKTEGHPANNMSDLNCRLLKLTIYHPYAQWLSGILQTMQLDHQVSIEPVANTAQAYMRAEFETPNGVRVLDGRPV